MRLSVIEGGAVAWRRDAGAARVEDVLGEAARRRRAIGFDEWRVREFVTGRPMPSDIKYLELQITYAADALSRLSPIPSDFDSDIYWPAFS
jgi:hypothetical protein